ANDLLAQSNRYGKLDQLLERSIDEPASQFTYDAKLRLLRIESEGAIQEEYALDPVDNRVADQNIPGSWEYDESNRLIRAGETTYEYDANDNLIRDVWPAQDQLLLFPFRFTSTTSRRRPSCCWSTGW
ncbi:MAG TPA: hypothetical protein VFU53_11110, partial [Burkholderiales bacterium]|nr:hypothetical protein [Burkholderiales bacterium]